MSEQNEIVIARPEVTALQTQVEEMVEEAREIRITNRDEHEVGLTLIKSFREQERQITQHFEPTRKALDTAKKEVLQARDSLVKPIAEARGVIDGKAQGYESEQRRIVEEAEAKARAETEAAEAKRIEEAEKALDAGDDEVAEQILEAPAPPVAPVAAPEVAKVSGVSTSTRYSAEIIDKGALIRFVGMFPKWEHLLEPNMPALNRIAVVDKDDMAIPGVKAVSKTVRRA